MGIPTLKSWHFEATEDIITKFKSQGLHIIRIKYWNASGSGSPPSLIPALWNIGILLHKQATLGKHFRPECRILAVVRRRRRNSKKTISRSHQFYFPFKEFTLFFVKFRISEKMCYEQLAIFYFYNFPSPALIRQKHATFLHISTNDKMFCACKKCAELTAAIRLRSSFYLLSDSDKSV